MENRIIDNQLEVLRDKLMALGDATERALERSMRSLTERDSDLARHAIDEDKAIDQMELEIDRLSIEILALQRPAAHDLRFVIAIAKITPVLERIADHAASIAEGALRLNEVPPIKELVDLPAMARTAGDMLHRALVAFTNEDSAAAREIIKEDHVIDACYKRVFDELLGIMIDDPNKAASAAQLLFVAKHLERIGDYVKDVCELNVYLTEAAFIKHSKED